MAKATTTNKEEIALNQEEKALNQEEKAATEPKMVKIKLFKDNGEYKDDVFVQVNSRRYQIKRGVEVEVPEFVKEVLDNSDKQDRLTAELIEKEEAKYQANSK